MIGVLRFRLLIWDSRSSSHLFSPSAQTGRMPVPLCFAFFVLFAANKCGGVRSKSGPRRAPPSENKSAGRSPRLNFFAASSLRLDPSAHSADTTIYTV
jgi:hypothetical protein